MAHCEEERPGSIFVPAVYELLTTSFTNLYREALLSPMTRKISQLNKNCFKTKFGEIVTPLLKRQFDLK